MGGHGQVAQAFTISTIAVGRGLSSPFHLTPAVASRCSACSGVPPVSRRVSSGSPTGACGHLASIFRSTRCFANGWAIVARSTKPPVISLHLAKTKNRVLPWRRWPCCSSGTCGFLVRGAVSCCRTTSTARFSRRAPSRQLRFSKAWQVSESQRPNQRMQPSAVARCGIVRGSCAPRLMRGR